MQTGCDGTNELKSNDRYPLNSEHRPLSRKNEKDDHEEKNGTAKEFLKKTCEVEELRAKISENCVRLRKLAAKLAKDG